MPRPLARLMDDTWLRPFQPHLDRRAARVAAARQRYGPLAAFASSHEYYGLHRTAEGWVFREWAPGATAIFLVGDHSGWQELPDCALHVANDRGDWEISLPADRLQHAAHYRLGMHWPGGSGPRLPSHARRVVQDPATLLFSCQIWDPEPYQWKNTTPDLSGQPLLIYEAHIGMAQEKGGVGTYWEFKEHVLPRVARAGYNTLQLMAVQEHPYYGSFGYHVANFFASSSRFGTPEELKELIDAAHALGLRVIIDLVHSHSVKNEAEGLALFDGTPFLYFHDGPRGFHEAWDSRCFDYAKPEVVRFLLSNCRYWIEEFRLDGFRFDGVTSMLYDHHGLGDFFHGYDSYFTPATDEDALTYLALANELIHQLHPQAVTIAEDVSGMPGLAAPLADGGTGFDARLAMGVPDHWFKLAADTRDEDWHVEGLYHELTNRRADERTISYVESHDQSIVGGKTFLFELLDASIYTGMSRGSGDPVVDRGIALWKIARLLTVATAGDGVLNFIGNEFGHPEWVDFPREGNGWSSHYARRQWSLRDNPALIYSALGDFDQALLTLLGTPALFNVNSGRLYSHVSDQVLVIGRGPWLVALNLNPVHSFTDRAIPVLPGSYQLLLDTDETRFCGHGRLTPGQRFFSAPQGDYTSALSLYLPSRCALVLKREPDSIKTVPPVSTV